ncbi:SMI1/KNR4 family protein [Yersinia nurmii]|uniref:SMI1/KNR4 family protein n=1 Tax=Yersinia nurmii TaxID=685706 RepID=A0AAW7K8A1_9GAMM|nr:SMI1/KNR4 family protein [Yersinia nurmii]MDN0087391.1 SMI1/KNR4 family protein [Yersinia nurmii]
MPISCGNGSSDVQINNLEQLYSIHFPNDYRNFLSVYNGFVVKQPDYCELPCNDVDDGYIAFYSLFGFGVSNKNHDINHQNKEYLDELSFIEEAFIIGGDPGGNYFVLVCNGVQKGVYYWDRTHLHSEYDMQKISIQEVDECGSLYKIHHEFSDFFAELVRNTIDKGMKLTKDLS